MDKNSAAKNFIWNAIGTCINSFMSFIYLVTVTRINGIDVSGIFSVCFSLTFILYTFSNLGNRVYEVSDRERDDNIYFTAKLFTGVISIVAGLVFCLISGYTLQKLLIVVILTLVRFVEALSDTLYAVFQKADRLDTVGISYTIKNAVVLSVFIITDILTGNILWAAFSMLPSTLAVYLFYDRRIMTKHYNKISYVMDFGRLTELAKALSFFVVFNLVVIVISTAPRLIADTKYSDSQMGIFGVIMMIPTVMTLFGQLLIQPCLNSLTENFAEKKYSAFSKTVTLIMSAMVAAAVICSAAAYLLGPPILGFILNVELDGYAFVMVIAIIAGMFNVFVTFISMLLTIMRRTKQQLYIYIGVLLTECILVFLAASTLNFTLVFVAYMAAMIIEFVSFFVYYLYSYKAEADGRCQISDISH